MAHEEIALALGISRPTLEKHFQHELSIGAYKKRLQVMDAMHGAAVKGNVAAGRAYLALSQKASAPPISPPEKSENPEGKKAQAQAAAVTAQAGSEWENLLTPGRQVQ